MREWIKQVKSEEEGKFKRMELLRLKELRERELILSKLPALWQKVIWAVKDDVEDLRSFSQSPQYCVDFNSPDPNILFLQNRAFPSTRLEARLENRQRIIATLFRFHSRFSGPLEEEQSVRAAIGLDERVEIVFRGVLCLSAEKLAEQFVKAVCG